MTPLLFLLSLHDALPILLLSVPRDSIVPIPGSGEGKINAAFAHGGPKLLVKTLEQSTGLRIDNYIEMGFGGLAGDRKSTRLNSSHVAISYAVFCLKQKRP